MLIRCECEYCRWMRGEIPRDREGRRVLMSYCVTEFRIGSDRIEVGQTFTVLSENAGGDPYNHIGRNA